MFQVFPSLCGPNFVKNLEFENNFKMFQPPKEEGDEKQKRWREIAHHKLAHPGWTLVIFYEYGWCKSSEDDELILFL